MLNVQQNDAVKYNGLHQNLLVLAGAGCGKTTTIIERIAHLSDTGVSINRILLLTFTNRSASDMKSRLKKRMGLEAEHLFAGTFHKLGLVVLSKMPHRFGINGLTIIDADDQISLMSLCRASLVKGESKEINKALPKANELISLLSYAANSCIKVEKHLSSKISNQEIRSLALKIFELYKVKKIENGYLDYDDLLVRFAEGMEHDEELRNTIASVFSHVLVDEFQDTNKLQFRILKCLTANGANMFCVGDDAQSIYAFRGAEFEHSNQFEELFPNATTLPLTINYRSNQEILDVSNWLLDRSPLPYDKHLVSAEGKCGKRPSMYAFDDELREASFIADSVEERQEEGLKLKDMAIIVPTSWSAKTIEGELVRRNIPYKFIGGTQLMKSAHVRDVISLARLGQNFKDELSWLRFLTMFPRIGEKSASSIIEQFVDRTEADVLPQLEFKFGKEHPIVQCIKHIQESSHDVEASIKGAIVHLLPVLQERYSKWNSRQKDLQALVKIASTYSDMKEFLHAMTLDPLSDTEANKTDETDVLTVITVHSAKGTEYHTTFVACVNPGMYPHTRSYGNFDAEEEQRRVLYVALTRAIKELVITKASSSRTGYTSYSKSCIGEEYFLSDLPTHIVNLKSFDGTNPFEHGGLSMLTDW